MAHLFSDNTKPSYDADEGKFVDNPLSTYDPMTWADDAEFLQKVDLSVPGMMQDCAECHVGGGPMEYIPNNDPTARTPLRTYAAYETSKGVTGTQQTAWSALVDTFDADGDGIKYEVLDVNYASTGVLEMDCLLCHMKGYDYIARRDTLRQAKFDAAPAVGAGVATRAVTEYPDPLDPGQTLGDVAWGDGDWSHVRYNTDLVEDDGTGNLKFNFFVIDALKTQPPSRNCGFCHFDQDLDDDPTTGYEGSDNHGSVDWKKRGDSWRGDVNHDVHTVLGCMGCHEAKAGTAIGNSGLASSSDLGQCDPAKGIAPFSSVWGKTDASVKTCAECHLQAGLLQFPTDEIDNVTGLPGADGIQDLAPVDLVDNGTGLPPADGIQDEVGGVLVWGDPVFFTSDVGDYGAPDPTAKHQQYGLTAVIASSTNDGGPANASHMDILDCGACHVGKVSTDAWNNGGCVVDATGGDLFDRLADHENQYVHRSMFIDTTTFGALDGVPDSPNITFSWLKGKIVATSALTTLYYRDKDDANTDVNNDGMGGGQDAILMTHLMELNEANYGVNHALSEQTHGTLTDAEVGPQITYLNNNLKALNGDTGTYPYVFKLSSMSVPFKVQHNIAPVGQYVLGKSCADCHDSTGMLARDYDLKPDNLTYGVTSTHATPLTKANGVEAAVTTFHPNLKDRKAGRTIARNYTATGGLGTIQVSQMLYEDDFKTRVPFGVFGQAVTTGDLSRDIDSVTAGVQFFNAKGKFLRLELTDGVTTWKRNVKFEFDAIEATQIHAALSDIVVLGSLSGQAFGDYDYEYDSDGDGDIDGDDTPVTEFTFAINGNAITFTPAAQLKIRFDSLTDAGFGVVDQVFNEAFTIAGVGGAGTYDGHNAWAGYLTGGFDASAYGIGALADPTATITGLPATVDVGTVVTLTAGASAAANSQFFWTVNDISESTVVNVGDPHDPDPGQTSSWTFNYPGTWKVLLTVVAPDGQLAQQMDEIQVVRDLADTQVAAPIVSASSPTVTLNLSAIPTHDQLYFFFGDGTRLSETYPDLPGPDGELGTADDIVQVPAGTYQMIRDYRLKDMFLDGTDYVYTTSIQVKNAGVIVEVVNVEVVIPQ